MTLAVEGMEHMYLAPACYEFREARIPSRNTMLKLRKPSEGSSPEAGRNLQTARTPRPTR